MDPGFPRGLITWGTHQPIITIRNSSCGKVMFSQASVFCRGVGGGLRGWGHAWQGGSCVWLGACVARGKLCVAGVCGKGGMHGRGMCGRRDDHCSEQYASYWNAFLSGIIFAQICMKIKEIGLGDHVSPWTNETPHGK